MRCKACNDNLNNQESTRKAVVTGEYLDLCNRCFKTIKDEVAVIENYHLEETGIENDTD